MRRTTYALALVFAAALGSPAAAGWWDAAGGAKETTLAELRQDPERWRDVTIVVPVRFASVRERVNPFFTQFHPGKWQPLAVKAVGERDGGVITYDRVFVPRGSELERRLGTLEAGEPLLLRGVVRDTAGDEPWIEVLSLTGAEDALTPEEQGRVRQADEFLAKSNSVAAETLYRDVLAARKLGERERGRLRAKLGAALLAQGRLEDARIELHAALEIDPLDRGTSERLERVTAALAAPKSAPPTARIARPAPEPPSGLRDPLRLPGDRPRLAPPSGLDRGAAPSLPAASLPAPSLPAPSLPATSLAATSLPAPSLPASSRSPQEIPTADLTSEEPTEEPLPEVIAPRKPPLAAPIPPSVAPPVSAPAPPIDAVDAVDDVARRLPAPPRRNRPAPPSVVERRATPPLRRATPPAPARPIGAKPGKPLPTPIPAPVAEDEPEEEPVPPLPSRPPLVGPK